MTSIYVTPQGWLDKTRESMNPLLLMGAPVMSIIMIFVGMFSSSEISVNLISCQIFECGNFSSPNHIGSQIG